MPRKRKTVGGADGQSRRVQTKDHGHSVSAPPPDLDKLLMLLKHAHRDNRFFIKQQSRIDRSLESYVRISVFGFNTGLPEDERKRISAAALVLIKLCRKGEQRAEHDRLSEIIGISDGSRSGWDKLRKDRVGLLENLAKQLPGFEFVENTHGVGAVGFAQIVGEAGDLSNYPTVAKLWKRLGLAPYQGLAMSTWRRETWRPRALTSDEWVANPFSKERYAIIAQIAVHLRDAQWVGKAKDPAGLGYPKDMKYGKLYYRRRQDTKIKHPDWSDGHAQSDALRYMIKKFIRDLWTEWRRANSEVSVTTTSRLPSVLSTDTAQAVGQEATLALHESATTGVLPDPIQTGESR